MELWDPFTNTTLRQEHVRTGSLFASPVISHCTTGTDITPVSGGDLYFGFGGVAVDLTNPGTVMVAALNSWYPDGQIFRSIDGGTTWSAFWAWGDYPQLYKYYTYSDSLAPWLGPDYVDTNPGDLQIGWMMECKCLINHYDLDTDFLSFKPW